MSFVSYKDVMLNVNELSIEELRKLYRVIARRLQQTDKQAEELPPITQSYMPPGFVPRIVGESPRSMKDRSREDAWLTKHRDEYANQWVALDGDRLLSHGPKLKEVIETARAAGVPDALCVRVEPSDALPYMGM